MIIGDYAYHKLPHKQGRALARRPDSQRAWAWLASHRPRALLLAARVGNREAARWLEEGKLDVKHKDESVSTIAVYMAPERRRGQCSMIFVQFLHLSFCFYVVQFQLKWHPNINVGIKIRRNQIEVLPD
jgi:hypothetical protein